MSEKNKDTQNILQNLQSNNEGIVLKGLQDARNKESVEILPAIINLMTNTKNPTVFGEIKLLLSELKIPNASDILVEYAGKESTIGFKDILIASLWRSGFSCEKHLKSLVNIACTEDYMTAFEALTVIANMESPLNQKELLECVSQTNEAIQQENDDKKNNLLKSLLGVLELYYL